MFGGKRLRDRRLLLFVAGLVCVTLTAAACGSEDEDASPEGVASVGAAAFPVTIEADNGPVEIAAEPSAIVSLSPSSTEILFAIGAGDQVVAVDDQSDFPAGVPTTDLSGFQPNVEAIAAFEPDLVIYATETGDLERSLGKLAIPALQHDAPSDLDGTYEQIEELGEATGHPEEATALLGEIAAEVDSIVASVPEATEPVDYYHELDPTYFTATEDSFIGAIYELVGLRNIAEGVKGASAGYVQLSEEHIIDSDPDLIFLADSECCNESAATVAKRPGWKQIGAVAKGHVFDVPDDIASRWGPRVTDFLRIVADAVIEVSG